jgi:hypothetical protein
MWATVSLFRRHPRQLSRRLHLTAIRARCEATGPGSCTSAAKSCTPSLPSLNRTRNRKPPNFSRRVTFGSIELSHPRLCQFSSRRSFGSAHVINVLITRATTPAKAVPVIHLRTAKSRTIRTYRFEIISTRSCMLIAALDVDARVKPAHDGNGPPIRGLSTTS